MKSVFLILFSIFFASSLFAQWVQQNSGTNQNLYDVEFINSETGWALGDGGVIIKTTNSGSSWINIPNPSINAGGVLVSIYPVNENVVYVVGGHNILIKTTNSGLSWMEIRNGPFGGGNGLSGVYFINPDTGWFCGANRCIRTTNGGITFDSVYIPWFSNEDIYFKDYNTGLISNEGYILKTTNSGFTWYNTNVPNQATYFFRKLAISNENVWVIGNIGNVFKSTNFGEDWSLVDTVATSGGFIGIDFSSDLIGFCGSTGNRMYKTSDGGFTWKRENTGNNSMAFISSIRFINDLTGWYVGGAGNVFHTTTGGLTPVISNTNTLPEYNLLYNYPNPFNPTTKISYSLKIKQLVEINIYDSKGNLIKNQVNKIQEPGTYTLEFNGNDLSSGVYFYSLVLDGKTVKANKMVLMK